MTEKELELWATHKLPLYALYDRALSIEEAKKWFEHRFKRPPDQVIETGGGWLLGQLEKEDGKGS